MRGLDRGGSNAPEDYVLVGCEERVREQIASYEAAGVTDFGIQYSGSAFSGTCADVGIHYGIGARTPRLTVSLSIGIDNFEFPATYCSMCVGLAPP